MVSSKATANIGWQALGTAIAFTAVALVAVLMRWYTRVFLIQRVRLEDYLITVALMFSMALTGVIGGEAHLDTGHRIDEIRPSLITTMMKLVFAQSISYHTSINLVKVAIVLQYIFIFTSTPFLRRICYAFLFSIATAAAWGVFGVVFRCNPTRKYWYPTIPGACMDPERHFWSAAIVGIFLDFAIWLLPIPVVAKLRLPPRQWYGLFVAFGLGFFVCIVSILRLALVHDAAEHENVTKSGTYAVIWSTVEVNVAIICASLMVMKPLLIHFFPSMSSRSKPRSSYQGFQPPLNTWPGTRSTLDEKEDGDRPKSAQSAGTQMPFGSWIDELGESEIPLRPPLREEIYPARRDNEWTM